MVCNVGVRSGPDLAIAEPLSTVDNVSCRCVVVGIVLDRILRRLRVNSELGGLE